MKASSIFVAGILGYPSAPTIDGEFLPKHPLELMKDQNFEDIELLIGSNRDEGKSKNVSLLV